MIKNTNIEIHWNLKLLTLKISYLGKPLINQQIKTNKRSRIKNKKRRKSEPFQSHMKLITKRNLQNQKLMQYFLVDVY